MTTKTLLQLRAEQRDIRAKLANHRALAEDPDLLAWMAKSQTQERLDKLAVDSAAYEAKLESELAALIAEEAEAEKTQCFRCFGTGEYQAPSSRTRQGKKICFRCGGSGKARKGH